MRTASGNRYGSTISGAAYPGLCVALRSFATEIELEVTSSVTRVSTIKLRTTVSPCSLPRRALDRSTLGIRRFSLPVRSLAPFRPQPFLLRGGMPFLAVVTIELGKFLSQFIAKKHFAVR